MGGRTQKELARELAHRLRIPEAKARRFLRLLLEMVADDLVEHGRVELRGLGTFQTVERSSRRIPDPTTIGDGVPDSEIEIPAYRVIRFRASKRLKDRLGPS